MQVSAEIRWFWANRFPPGLKEWFCEPQREIAAGGGVKPREDEYLRDSGQSEMGIKRRGGKKGVEVKGLVAVISQALAAGPFQGELEVWTKWTTESLDLPSQLAIKIEKRRWLRKFDTTGAVPVEIQLGANEQPVNELPLPDFGCNVEFTEVRLSSGDVWWTFGFESFGAIETVENSLRVVAAEFSERRPPDISFGTATSYPAWLKAIRSELR